MRVEYGGVPVYGRVKCIAGINLDDAISLSGYGETHTAARLNLIEKLEAHARLVIDALEAVRDSEPPVYPVRR